MLRLLLHLRLRLKVVLYRVRLAVELALGPVVGVGVLLGGDGGRVIMLEETAEPLL